MLADLVVPCPWPVPWHVVCRLGAQRMGQGALQLAEGLNNIHPVYPKSFPAQGTASGNTALFWLMAVRSTKHSHGAGSQ